MDAPARLDPLLTSPCPAVRAQGLELAAALPWESIGPLARVLLVCEAWLAWGRARGVESIVEEAAWEGEAVPEGDPRDLPLLCRADVAEALEMPLWQYRDGLRGGEERCNPDGLALWWEPPGQPFGEAREVGLRFRAAGSSWAVTSASVHWAPPF